MANKITCYHLMLFLLSLPYDMFYSHIILISLIVHTLLHFRKENVKPLFTRDILLLQSVFFLTLFGTLYSINRPEGLKELGMQVTIFLFPLVYCLNPLDLHRYRDKLLMVFSLGCVLAIGYLYLHAIITITYYHYGWGALFSYAFINHNFSLPLDIHATYLSLQVGIALVYLFSRLVKETMPWRRLSYGCCCVMLAAGIIQLSSRSVFAALLLIIGLGMPYFMLAGTRRARFLLWCAAALLLIIAGIYGTERLRSRYVTELKADLSGSPGGELFDPRLARWNVGVRIAAGSPLIGYGAGSEQKLLREGYFEKKFYRSYLANLNAHNQYLGFFIRFGILGLLVFLLTLAFGYKMALEKKDLLLFAFLLLTTLVCLSENILDRDKGIFFYSAFFTLFVFSNRTNNKAAA